MQCSCIANHTQFSAIEKHLPGNASSLQLFALERCDVDAMRQRPHDQHSYRLASTLDRQDAWA